MVEMKRIMNMRDHCVLLMPFFPNRLFVTAQKSKEHGHELRVVNCSSTRQCGPRSRLQWQSRSPPMTYAMWHIAHLVTYIICFTFATRTPLDIRSA